MAVTIKSQRGIELMRESCKILADVFQNLEQQVKPGMTTMEINIQADKMMRAHGCIPNFLHYEGYPASICVSVNDEVVHGIPNKHRVLKDGDIVSLDAGLIYKGYHSDMARTFGIGDISEEARLLIERTKQSFFDGIAFAKEGNHLYDISNGIADSIDRYGYGIVKELVGHGIGTSLHEDPQIPNYHMKKHGIRLTAGMTLAVEPMINLGGADVEFMDDGWTVVTSDGSISAHYENTILITDGEPEILTLY